MPCSRFTRTNGWSQEITSTHSLGIHLSNAWEAAQRPSAFEFVSNEAHVFEPSWYLLVAAKRQGDIESRRPQCVNRVADQRSAVEFDRRLVPADAKAMAAGEYCSDVPDDDWLLVGRIVKPGEPARDWTAGRNGARLPAVRSRLAVC